MAAESDRLIKTYVAPVLMTGGYRRRRHSFVRAVPTAVAEIAIQESKYGGRFTASGAVAYRAWNEFLHAPKSLDHPVRYPDYQTHLFGSDPATGLTTHQWYELTDDGAQALARDLKEQMLPNIASNGTPAADYARLRALFDAGKCERELLARLFFWMVVLEKNDAVELVSEALVSAGKSTMRDRILEHAKATL